MHYEINWCVGGYCLGYAYVVVDGGVVDDVGRYYFVPPHRGWHVIFDY